MQRTAAARTPTVTTTTAPAGSEPLARSPVLWLTSVSHGVDHFQQHMLGALYPLIMAELGFGYAQLGVLTAVKTFLASGCQVVYGFLAPFVRRSRLLAFGNLVSGLGTLLTALAPSYPVLVGSRALFATGSSVQHPVGASILANHFTRNRGTALTINSTVAGVGSLLAPIAVGYLSIILGWRQIFLLFAFVSLAVGVVCLLYRARGERDGQRTAKRARWAESKASYLRVLRNRNMMVISLIMMVGAAGRGDGLDSTYLGPHLVNDLGMSIAVVGLVLTVIQLGSIFGGLGLGWLSDRLSRRRVMQVSLLLSTFATWWLAFQGAYLPVLLLNVLIYGVVTSSRNALTQALMADVLPDADRDAAFSLYFFIGFASSPIWALTTGFLMEAFGFAVAFSVAGCSYLAGMLLLFLIDMPDSAKRTETSRVS